MNAVLPTTPRHFSNCNETAQRLDELGRSRCTLCGCVVHPALTSNVCATGPAEPGRMNSNAEGIGSPPASINQPDLEANRMHDGNTSTPAPVKTVEQ